MNKSIRVHALLNNNCDLYRCLPLYINIHPYIVPYTIVLHKGTNNTSDWLFRCAYQQKQRKRNKHSLSVNLIESLISSVWSLSSAVERRSNKPSVDSSILSGTKKVTISFFAVQSTLGSLKPLLNKNLRCFVACLCV